MNFTQTLIWTLLLPYRGILHVTFVLPSFTSPVHIDHCLSLPHVEWDHDACWTHKNSNNGGLFQLDYMLVSENVHDEACVVR